MSGQLRERYRIGCMELWNRIVAAPMGTQYAAVEGCVTERLISYHEARPRVGARLPIIENSAVHRLGVSVSHQVKIGKGKFILSLRCLIDGIHAQVAKTESTIAH